MLQTRIVPFQPAMMLLGRKKSLVVTDIHIGFETSLAANEIFIGKNSTIHDTVSELSEMILAEKPDGIILLGDVKSSIKRITGQEWDDVPLFFEKIQEICDVTLIPGNHDANIQRMMPDNVSMISSAGLVEENVLLTHGHTMPSGNFGHVDKIIMGHVHPVFFQEESVLNGQRVWVSLKTDKQDIFPDQSGELEITIVPSFNRYFYATHKRRYRRSISPIIERINGVRSARIVTLDGTIIGDESMLERVL